MNPSGTFERDLDIRNDILGLEVCCMKEKASRSVSALNLRFIKNPLRNSVHHHGNVSWQFHREPPSIYGALAQMRIDGKGFLK
jgi:hypothetical protein